MKIIIDGFKNKRHAQMFISWYEGGGEQLYGDHVECIYENAEEKEMDAYVDMEKSYPLQIKDGAYIVNIR